MSNWFDNEDVTITVEQSHIDKGEKGSIGFCPIALAIKDFDGVTDVEADGNDIIISYYHLDDMPVREYFITPDEAWMFMQEFDDGEEVDPFTFTAVRS